MCGEMNDVRWTWNDAFSNCLPYNHSKQRLEKPSARLVATLRLDQQSAFARRGNQIIASLIFDLTYLRVCRHPRARRQPIRYRSRRRPLALAYWPSRGVREQQFRWFAPRITAPLL